MPLVELFGINVEHFDGIQLFAICIEVDGAWLLSDFASGGGGGVGGSLLNRGLN